MRVSLIIPTLNEAEGIDAALDSALACGADEVIVADGGSRDGMQDIVKKARGCVLIESPRGRAVQQNLGARAATGDVLLFLHADCRLAAYGCARIRAALANADVLAGAFRQHIEAEGRLYRALEWGNAWRVRRLGLAYGDQGLFFRRQFFEELGGFPEIALMEDLRLSRLVRSRTRWRLLEGPLFVNARRWQKHGVVRQTARNWMLLTAERLGVSPDRLAGHYRPHA